MNNKEKLYLVKNAGISTEAIGALLGPYLGGAAAGLSALPFGSDMVPGAAAAGYIAPSAISALAALISNTRSREEQVAAESDSLMNLVPGVGGYNLMKRMGHSAWGEGSPGEEAEEMEETEEE